MQTLTGFLLRFNFFLLWKRPVSPSQSPVLPIRLLFVISVLLLNDLCLLSSSYRFNVFKHLTSPGTFPQKCVYENGRKVTNHFFYLLKMNCPSTRYKMPMWMDRNDYYRLAWSMLLLFLIVDFRKRQPNKKKHRNLKISENFSNNCYQLIFPLVRCCLNSYVPLVLWRFFFFNLLLSINMLTWEQLNFRKNSTCVHNMFSRLLRLSLRTIKTSCDIE